MHLKPPSWPPKLIHLPDKPAGGTRRHQASEDRPDLSDLPVARGVEDGRNGGCGARASIGKGGRAAHGTRRKRPGLNTASGGMGRERPTHESSRPPAFDPLDAAARMMYARTVIP